MRNLDGYTHTNRLCSLLSTFLKILKPNQTFSSVKQCVTLIARSCLFVWSFHVLLLCVWVFYLHTDTLVFSPSPKTSIFRSTGDSQLPLAVN